MRKFLKSLSRDERGIAALEYAILAAVIVVAVVVGVTAFGDQIGDLFTKASTSISGAIDAPAAPGS